MRTIAFPGVRPLFISQDWVISVWPVVVTVQYLLNLQYYLYVSIYLCSFHHTLVFTFVCLHKGSMRDYLPDATFFLAGLSYIQNPFSLLAHIPTLVRPGDG